MKVSACQKFKNLWHAGLKASLNVDAENGEASVTLKADLGYIPPPFHVLRPHGQPPRPQRGPAYQRRQERRQAARAAAGNVVSHAEVACDALVRDTVEEVSEENASSAEEAIAETNDKENDAEKARENFECFECDFKSNWENGLKVHQSRKHCRIEQLDGNTMDNDEDTYQDEKYTATKHYLGKGKAWYCVPGVPRC